MGKSSEMIVKIVLINYFIEFYALLTANILYM